MKNPIKLRPLGRALAVAVGLAACSVEQGHAQAGMPVFAVAEVYYVDTSGEVVDQSRRPSPAAA